jgi:hypothetical protein
MTEGIILLFGKAGSPLNPFLFCHKAEQPPYELFNRAIHASKKKILLILANYAAFHRRFYAVWEKVYKKGT